MCLLYIRLFYQTTTKFLMSLYKFLEPWDSITRWNAVRRWKWKHIKVTSSKSDAKSVPSQGILQITLEFENESQAHKKAVDMTIYLAAFTLFWIFLAIHKSTTWCCVIVIQVKCSCGDTMKSFLKVWKDYQNVKTQIENCNNANISVIPLYEQS